MSVYYYIAVLLFCTKQLTFKRSTSSFKFIFMYFFAALCNFSLVQYIINVLCFITFPCVKIKSSSVENINLLEALLGTYLVKACSFKVLLL